MAKVLETRVLQPTGMRFGSGNPMESLPPDDPDPNRVKLNLGSGSSRWPGWTNVDFDKDLEPDVVADVEHLPMENESVDEIYASHVLEHVPCDSPALGEWKRVLKPGGHIVVVVPDILQMYYLYHHGGFNLMSFNATVYGGRLVGYPEEGHTHKQVFMLDMLQERMLEFFPNAHAILKCPLHACLLGESMVEGNKEWV
jgi:predicted SAM-dependent methyltransferase